MPGEVTADVVSGITKKVYDDGIIDLRSGESVLQRLIPFRDAPRIGDTYQWGVALRGPNGVTYLGSDATVVDLKQPRNMVLKQAAAKAFEFDLREQLAYGVISRLSGGEGALKNMITELMSAMQMSMSNRIEASMLHGQRGYGTVESVANGGTDIVDVVFTDATFAPGMFQAIGEGSTWDFHAGTAVKGNTAVAVLSRITSTTRTIRFSVSGAAAGVGGIVAGMVIHPEGAYGGTTVYNDMPGLLVQASNTSGTSLGIDASTYGNWAGNTYAVGGVFSHGTLEGMVSQLRDRGGTGKIVALMSNASYAALATEIGQLQMFQGTGTASNAKVGVKNFSYVSKDVGDIEVIAHPFMKKSEILLLPAKECVRVGSTDITFGLRGVKNQLVNWVPARNAYEYQNYTDQAVILKRPNQAMLATGITY